MILSFDIHGVGLELHSTLPDATELLSGRLRPYLRAKRAESDVALRICAAPSTFSDPDTIKPELRWFRTRPLWGDISEEVLRYTDGASVACIDYASRSAEIFLSAKTLLDRHFCARTFLLLSVVELLRTQGFFYIHGALVTNGSRSLLFLGKGGSGKSTLAASLLQKGFRLVADDNLLLEADSGSLYPLEQELSLSPQAAKALGLPFSGSLERGKLRASLQEFPEELRAGHAKPTDIVILAGQSGPDSRADVMRVLLEENPLAITPPALATAHLRAYQALVRQACCRSWHIDRAKPIDFDNPSLRF